MTRVDDYRAQLRDLDDWEPFLRAESRLPGPRANLELAQAAALEGDPQRLAALRNEPDEFLVMCGVIGLDDLGELRTYAADPRWRVREAVAMAVQRIGSDAVPAMREWARGTRFEQRAAVAALCEPPLLRDEATARAALEVLDVVTGSLADPRPGEEEGEKALRRALSHGWSVAVAALPDPGRAAIERWIADGDAGTRRIMRENLRKARLARLDGEWVDRQLAKV